jgi:hypothetical protein
MIFAAIFAMNKDVVCRHEIPLVWENLPNLAPSSCAQLKLKNDMRPPLMTPNSWYTDLPLMIVSFYFRLASSYSMRTNRK